MSNMSYCRFRNTFTDFVDCHIALTQIAVGELEPLSDDELQAAKKLAIAAHELIKLLCHCCDLRIQDLNERRIEHAIQLINDTAKKARSTH